ncbi:hypothetical protein B0H15DRAFT_1022959, partial [Mycena belliarum]
VRLLTRVPRKPTTAVFPKSRAQPLSRRARPELRCCVPHFPVCASFGSLRTWALKLEALEGQQERAPGLSPCARTGRRPASSRSTRTSRRPGALSDSRRSTYSRATRSPSWRAIASARGRAERALLKHSLPRVLSSRPCSRDARVGRARRDATAGVRRPPRREGAGGGGALRVPRRRDSLSRGACLGRRALVWRWRESGHSRAAARATCRAARSG